MKTLNWFSAVAVLISLPLTACATPTGGPTTWLDQPLDGDQVPLEALTLKAHASDANGVNRVEFLERQAKASS